MESKGAGSERGTKFGLRASEQTRRVVEDAGAHLFRWEEFDDTARLVEDPMPGSR